MNKVYMTRKAKESLNRFADKNHTEVSGVGTVEVLEKKILVTDVVLLDDLASPNYSGLVNESVVSYLDSISKNGGDVDAVKVWWHSHGWQNVGWSQCDDKTIADLQNNWMVSIVVNKNGDMRARIDTPKKRMDADIAVVEHRNLVLLED